MATITIPNENKQLNNPKEIATFLKPYGIYHESWKVEGRLKPDATDQQILDTYHPEIERLKTAGGYVTADVINVNPDTPNLQALLDKFNKEHTHSEDEVRFVVEGRGVFHIHGEHPETGKKIFAIQVNAGDLINVPKDTKHWFNLCDDKQIRCIRLFQDPNGWTPNYIEQGEHGKYQPLCFGPESLSTANDSAVPSPSLSPYPKAEQ